MRPASRGLQHPSVNRIRFLHGFESLGQAPGALAGASEGEQEEEDGGVASEFTDTFLSFRRGGKPRCHLPINAVS